MRAKEAEQNPEKQSEEFTLASASVDSFIPGRLGSVAAFRAPGSEVYLFRV